MHSGSKKSSSLHSVLWPYYRSLLSNYTALLRLRTVRTTAEPFFFKRTKKMVLQLTYLLPVRSNHNANIFAHNLYDDGAYIEVPSIINY